MQLEEERDRQLKVLKEKFKNDSRTKEFEKFSDEFEEMVRLGLAEKRGNKLLSPSDANKKSVFFNRAG